MITSIMLQNFMAHGHSEIALAPGVTVLTGPNNTGKSAVVEGLRCLSENPALGRHFIRHGAKQATVTVVLEDGTSLSWHRKKSTAWYEILRPGASEPEAFYKMGQGKVPPQVLELLRVQPVDIDEKNKVDVHLGDQRSPIFLLDRPGAQIAHFFAASSEGAHILAMQDRLKEQVRDAQKSRQRLLQAQLTQRRLLDSLEPLPKMTLDLESLEAEGREVAAMAAALPALERTASVVRSLRRQEAGLADRDMVLGRLVAPPVVAEVAKLAWLLGRREHLLAWQSRTTRRQRTLESLSAAPQLEAVLPILAFLAKRASLLRRQRAMEARQRTMEFLANPPPLKPVTTLAQWLLAAMRLRLASTRYSQREQAIAKLLPPPLLHDVATPGALARTWGRQRAARRAARERIGVLERAESPPVLLPVVPVHTAVQTARTLRRQQAFLQAKLDKSEATLKAKREAIAARLQEIGQCPTCGQSLTGETLEAFLRGDHRHGA